MNPVLPLDKMTVSDKLRVLEEIWDDLCHSSEDLPSPAWHREVLEAREKRAQEGASRFEDWSNAKRKIRESAGHLAF